MVTGGIVIQMVQEEMEELLTLPPPLVMFVFLVVAEGMEHLAMVEEAEEAEVPDTVAPEEMVTV
jgi:hypothetical protein